MQLIPCGIHYIRWKCIMLCVKVDFKAERPVACLPWVRVLYKVPSPPRCGPSPESGGGLG